MPLLHAEVGHQNTIVALAFSPDGGRILSGSRDGTAKIWDVSNGKLLRTLGWGSEEIQGVAWSPDGKLLAVAGYGAPVAPTELQLERFQLRDRTPIDLEEPVYGASEQLRIFGADDGSLVRVFGGAGGGVAFAPDGRTVAAILWHQLSIFDLQEGCCLARLKHPDIYLRNVSYSQDGRWLACIGDEGVFIFDARTAELLRVVCNPHLFNSPDPSPLDAFAIQLPDVPEYVDHENLSAYCVHWWQRFLAEFRPTFSFQGGGQRPSPAFSSDGSRAALPFETSGSISCDAILVMNAPGCEVTHDLRVTQKPPAQWADRPPRASLTTVGFSPDSRFIAAAGTNKKIIVWDAKGGQAVAQIGEPPATVSAVAVSATEAFAATGGMDGAVGLFDHRKGSVVATRKLTESPIVQLDFSPRGDVLLIVQRHGGLRLVRVPDLEILGEIQAHPSQIFGGAWTLDGAQIVTAGYTEQPQHNRPWETELVAWSVPDGRRLFRQSLATGKRVTCFAASPDRRKLAITSPQEIWIADLADEVTIRPAITGLARRSACINLVAFTPDNAQLVVAFEGYGMCTLDLDSLTVRNKFNATRDVPTALAVSPDGRFLARSTAYFTEIELFELATGKLKKYFQGHQNVVQSLAFSLDGTTLVSGGSDGTLRLWNVASGALQASIIAKSD